MDSSLHQRLRPQDELSSSHPAATEDRIATFGTKESGDHRMPRYLSPTSAAKVKTKPKYNTKSPKTFKFGKPEVEEPKQFSNGSPVAKGKAKISTELSVPGYMQLTTAAKDKMRLESEDAKMVPNLQPGTGDELYSIKHHRAAKQESAEPVYCEPNSRYLSPTSAAQRKIRNKISVAEETSPRMKFGKNEAEKIPFLNLTDVPSPPPSKHQKKRGASYDANIPRYLSMTSASQVKARVKVGDKTKSPRMSFNLKSKSQERIPSKSPLTTNSAPKQDHTSDCMSVVDDLLKTRTIKTSNVIHAKEPCYRRVGVVSSSPPKVKLSGTNDSSIPRYLALTSAAKVKTRRKTEVQPGPKMRFGKTELSISPARLSPQRIMESTAVDDEKTTSWCNLNESRDACGNRDEPRVVKKTLSPRHTSDLALIIRDDCERSKNEKFKNRQTNSTSVSPMKRKKNSPKLSASDTNTTSGSNRLAAKTSRLPKQGERKTLPSSVPIKNRAGGETHKKINVSEAETTDPKYATAGISADDSHGLNLEVIQDSCANQNEAISKPCVTHGFRKLWVSKYHIDKDPKWVDAIELRLCDINDDGSLKLPLSDLEEVSQMYAEYDGDGNLGVKTGINFALTAGMLYLGYQIGIPPFKW